MGILNNPLIRDIAVEDCGESLVEVSERDFVLEPMYFKWGHNESETMELRSGVIEKLREAQRILRERMGASWKLKIWDGFRTLNTQQLLFDEYYRELEAENPDWTDEEIKDAVQTFVSFPSHDPNFPAPHNTGGAVDLTILDADGEELDMGTPFDEFTERAFTAHFAELEEEGSERIHRNRMLLKEIMEEVGFTNYSEEWWHFSYGDQAWALAKNLKKTVYGSKEL